MKKFLITEIVKICCQLHEIKKDNDVIKQDLDHANKMLAEAVRDFEDSTVLLTEILNFKDQGKLNQAETQKVLTTLTKFYRDQIMFDSACESILDHTL